MSVLNNEGLEWRYSVERVGACRFTSDSHVSPSWGDGTGFNSFPTSSSN